MTYTEAAERILAQAGHPLHFREITRQAIEQGLIEVEGLTPWNSMNGTLRRAIRTQGAAINIVSLGDGRFALRAWGLPAEEIGPADSAADSYHQPPAYRMLADDFADDDQPTTWEGKLRLAAARTSDLIARRSSLLPVSAPLEATLRAAVLWGAANMLSGLALVAGRTSALTRGLARQLFVGGAAHAALGIWALDGVVRQDEAVAAGRAPATSLVARRPWLEQAYTVGAGLGVLTLLAGLAANHQRKDDAQRGRGAGRILQGSFVALLAGAALWRKRQE